MGVGNDRRSRSLHTCASRVDDFAIVNPAELVSSQCRLLHDFFIWNTLRDSCRLWRRACHGSDGTKAPSLKRFMPKIDAIANQFRHGHRLVSFALRCGMPATSLRLRA